MSRSSANEDAARGLTLELERALLRELGRAYEALNQTYFRGALKRPALSLMDNESHLGRWHRDTRTLELARALVAGRPWGATLEVLKHEMVHQYVHEVLRVDEAPHGPAFVAACAKMGIDGRAAGPLPQGDPEASPSAPLQKIRRLLALASSESQHEAESAMRAAQRLMLKYNLERGDLSDRPYSFRHLGRPTGRVNEARRIIGTILGEHFFVEVIWVPVYRPLEGKRGSVLEVCGTVENLELASYVHDFLEGAGERLWKDHRRAEGLTGNRDRQTFIAGVMSGFYAKLNAERTRAKREGLVWIGDAELAQFYRSRHPYIQNVRYAGNRRNEAHEKGRSAGSKLVLRRPMGEGGTHRTPPRLGPARE